MRLSLAGAGYAAKVHALAAAEIPGATIAAVGTRSTGSAEEFAAELAAKPMSVDRLPAGGDAVVIATAPPNHAPLAIRLLNESTPVLIEKPLATTLYEADAIIAAAERSGAAACYAENLLFAPIIDLAVARRQALGPLDHLEVRMVQPAPFWGHFLEPLTAGGVLYDLGSHAVALLMVMAGDDAIEGVRARLVSSRDDGADDGAHVEVRFASRLIATIDTSWGGDVIDWSMQASSVAGVVRTELMPDLALEVDGEPVTLPEVDTAGDPRIYQLGYHAQLDGFCSVVARKGGRVCPVGFGRSVLEVLCAAYLSAGNDGEEVTLPFQGSRDLTPLQLWRS